MSGKSLIISNLAIGNDSVYTSLKGLKMSPADQIYKSPVDFLYVGVNRKTKEKVTLMSTAACFPRDTMDELDKRHFLLSQNEMNRIVKYNKFEPYRGYDWYFCSMSNIPQLRFSEDFNQPLVFYPPCSANLSDRRCLLAQCELPKSVRLTIAYVVSGGKCTESLSLRMTKKEEDVGMPSYVASFGTKPENLKNTALLQKKQDEMMNKTIKLCDLEPLHLMNSINGRNVPLIHYTFKNLCIRLNHKGVDKVESASISVYDDLSDVTVENSEITES